MTDTLVRAPLRRRGTGLLGATLALAAATAAHAAGTVPLRVGVHWSGELVTDAAGGLRRGSSLDSLLETTLDAKAPAPGLPAGGALHASAVAISSGNPSANQVGDLQAVSNIEAPDALRLYALWYRQRIAAGTRVRAGLIDFNAWFDVTDPAGMLLNASFGLDPTLSANLPVSTYPKPGFGAMLQHRHGPWEALAGVFQGDPSRRSSLWDGGYFAVAEIDREATHAVPFWFGVGLWRYRQPDPAAGPARLAGAYFNASYTLRDARVRRTRLFLQAGASPYRASTVPYHIGLGVDVIAPFADRPNDRFSAGLTRAGIRGTRAETTFEASYLWRVDAHLALQGDLQYVHHPSGSAADALVGLLRVHLDYD